MSTQTLLDKLWSAHVVDSRSDGSDLLYVDRHYVHDACSQGFDFLDQAGVPIRRPDLTFGMEESLVKKNITSPPDQGLCDWTM